jgi:tetratricopeptide (TPR) repeat protein
MRIPLQSPARKTCLLGASLALAAVNLGFATTQYLAAYFSERSDLVSLQRAVKLQSGNADYRYRLARYFVWVQNPQAAVESYRAAVRLNPHQARYWFDLAAVYQQLDNTDAQKDALEHAIIADPKTPEFAWEAAHLYVMQGDPEKALRELRVVLENDLSLSWPALQLCLRISPYLDTILHEVLPPNPSVYFAFLESLMAQKDTAAAAKVWAQLAALHQPLEKRRVFDYMRYLIEHQEVDQARLVWQQAASLCGLSAYQPSSENLVVNGDFSLEILNGGFDWLYHKSRDVALALDPTKSRSGHRSLSIAFDGRGIEDAGIRQLIPVRPNSDYEFTAYFKAEDMQGVGGPRFAIQDLYSQNTYLVSEELKDAAFWKQVNGTFTTGADTKLLVLRVQRVPAGSPIRGKLWIDGVRLLQKQP